MPEIDEAGDERKRSRAARRPSVATSSEAESVRRPGHASERNTEIIVILGLLAAIGPLSIDTYLPSMPAIANDFGVVPALVQQSVSAYFLGLALGQLVCGPLSDRFGRRPILYGGLGLYLPATVCCVLAPTATILIFARLVQGLGASATAAAGRAVIRDIWSGNRAARAMSFVMMVTAFAPLVAPIVGGQIFTYLGWRAIFGLMLVFACLLVALVALRLPETHVPPAGATLRVGDTFRTYGRVLGSGRALSYLLCGGLSYATMFAYITGSPSVYIRDFGVDPRYFGLLFGLNVIGLTLGNWLNTRYVGRFGYRRLLGIGAIIGLIGTLILLAFSITGTGGLVAVAAALFVAVGPVSMVGANAIAGVLNMYPHNAGAASALFGVSQFGFGAVAGVLVGALDRGTPAAMAIAMTVMAVGAMLAFVWLVLLPRESVADPAMDPPSA